MKRSERDGILSYTEWRLGPICGEVEGLGYGKGTNTGDAANLHVGCFNTRRSPIVASTGSMMGCTLVYFFNFALLLSPTLPTLILQ